MQRTFSSLSPCEALQVAISIEQRNAEVYHRFAEMFTEFGDEESLEIASVFWEMAVEEQGHRALLENKYLSSFGALSSVLGEHELSDLVEVPKLDIADILSNAQRVTAGQRALQVALEAEASAQRFYQALFEAAPAGPLRHMFRDLAQLEDDHVTYLESKLASDSTDKQTVQ